MPNVNKNFFEILTRIARPIVKFFFPYEVFGAENISKMTGGYIICSNHISNMDPIFLSVIYLKTICFMAKVELFRNKFLAFILKKLGTFAVDRSRADLSAIEAAKEVLKNGEILGIFIEGTRSKTGDFLRPKMGAAKFAGEMEVPVLPVCITGSGKNNKIRIFKKTKINFGAPIPADKLKIEGDGLKSLKAASNLIMEEIKSLRP